MMWARILSEKLLWRQLGRFFVPACLPSSFGVLEDPVKVSALIAAGALTAITHIATHECPPLISPFLLLGCIEADNPRAGGSPYIFDINFIAKLDESAATTLLPWHQYLATEPRVPLHAAGAEVVQLVLEALNIDVSLSEPVCSRR